MASCLVFCTGRQKLTLCFCGFDRGLDVLREAGRNVRARQGTVDCSRRQVALWARRLRLQVGSGRGVGSRVLTSAPFSLTV